MTVWSLIGFAAITAFILRALPFAFKNSDILNNVQGTFYRFLYYSSQAMLGVMSYEFVFGKTDALEFTSQFGFLSIVSLLLLILTFVLVVKTKKVLTMICLSSLLYLGMLVYNAGAAENDTATLRVAASPTNAHRLLQPHIACFFKRAQVIAINLENCASDALPNGVAEERCDIGITNLETRHSEIQVEPFRRSKMVCVLSAGRQLSKLENVTPSDLNERPLVTLPNGTRYDYGGRSISVGGVKTQCSCRD